MRDGVLRQTLKRGLARLYLSWLAAGRRRDPPAWDLGGACEGCGSCCEHPSIAVGWLFFAPVLRGLFIAWQRHVNGFVYAGDDRAARALVFSCSHFDAVSRRCDSYDSRPGMCRDYPRLLLHQAQPELFERCGYRAVDGAADGLLAVLRERGVAADTLVQIERRLKPTAVTPTETPAPRAR